MQQLRRGAYEESPDPKRRGQEDLNPATFSQDCYFIRFLLKKINSFLTNSYEENLFISSIVLWLAQTPFSPDDLRESDPQPPTLLHVLIFDTNAQHYNDPCGCILSALRGVSEKIDELSQERFFRTLKTKIKLDSELLGNPAEVRQRMKDYPKLLETFERHKKAIYAAIVF